MTTATGRRVPDAREYQPNGMPPGMSMYLLRVSGSDERITVITWSGSSADTVVATLDAQRFLSELFVPGSRVTGVFDRTRGLFLELKT